MALRFLVRCFQININTDPFQCPAYFLRNLEGTTVSALRHFLVYAIALPTIKSRPFSHQNQSFFRHLNRTRTTMPRRIVLYQTEASPSCSAVEMTAEYLGIKLTKKHVDLWKEEQMKPEFLKMNPQHCVPTIDDGGFYLWESRAIQTYLVNKYAPDSNLYPQDPQARAQVERMLYFDIGTVYRAESDYLFPQLFFGQAADPEKEEAFKKALDLFEGFLGKTSYAAADHITLADFSLLATLTFAELADYSYAPFPKISAWLQKLKSEVPKYKEINEVPLKEFKEFLKSKK